MSRTIKFNLVAPEKNEALDNDVTLSVSINSNEKSVSSGENNSIDEKEFLEISNTAVAFETRSGRKLTNKKEIEGQALDYLYKIANVEPNSPDAMVLLEEIGNIGARDIKKLSGLNNSFLSKQMLAEPMNVENAIEKFKKVASYLDPYAEKKNTLSKIFGFLSPKESPDEMLQKREKRIKEAEKMIDESMSDLYVAQNKLTRMNAAIEVEQEDMEVYMDLIDSKTYLVDVLGKYLKKYIDDQKPAYGEYLKSNFLFTLNQRTMNIYSEYGVCIQAYLFLEVMRKQNVELINWIKSCSSTKVSSLRTALLIEDNKDFAQQASDFIKEFEQVVIEQKDNLVGKSGDIERETREIKERINKLRILTGVPQELESVGDENDENKTNTVNKFK